jgi:pimeloyl-ACP methyl ester carboxylesterase
VSWRRRQAASSRTRPSWSSPPFHNDQRAPLLLIAEGKDHIAPAAVTRANAKLQSKSKAITAFKEFPERSHFTLGQEGWEEVADFALQWALDPQPTVEQS